MIDIYDLLGATQEVDRLAIRKTALLLDDELVAQVKALLGTGTTTETIAEAMREVIRVQGRARHFERMRRRELERDDRNAPG
jgi:Arc/MetJ family transcription regulator